MSVLTAYNVEGKGNAACAFILVDGTWYFIERNSRAELNAALDSIGGIESCKRGNKIKLNFNDSFITDYDSGLAVRISPNLDTIH